MRKPIKIRHSLLFAMVVVFLIYYINMVTTAPLFTAQKSGDFEYFTQIDTTKEPYQQNISNPANFYMDYSIFTVTPLAKYEISARIVSKRNYTFGWQSRISPLDIVFAWGQIVDDNYSRYVMFNQDSRMYYFNNTNDSPYKPDYIYSHSANSHIIPANKNIKKVINSLSVGQKVLMKGYLVRVDGNVTEGHVMWISSLSRNNQNDRSSEVFYVNKVMIDNRVYE